MADQLLKALALNNEVRIYTVNMTQTVAEAQKRHDTWHTATAALGRTMIATALLAANLKGNDQLTVQVQGQGPLGQITVDGNNQGHIRGRVDHPHVALELNADHALDVAGAVGLPGRLTVRKYIEDGSPFTGQVALVSGELAEDFTYYMAVSEQTPSAIGLSVLVEPDEQVASAAGFMIQMLPGAREETIAALEARLACLGSLSALIQDHPDPEDMLGALLASKDYSILSRGPVSYQCSCSYDRFLKHLELLNASDLESMIQEDHGADLVCHYCNESYQISEEALKEVLDRILEKKGDHHV